MPEAPEPAAILDDKAVSFYDGALRRAQKTTLALAVVTVLAGLAMRGWRTAAPLALGAAIGWLNFRWLMLSSLSLLSRVQRLTEESGGARPANLPGGVGSVARFLLRYLLLAAAAYVIVMWSVFSILALFCGLFLPIMALMAEAGYEVWVSYRKGL